MIARLTNPVAEFLESEAAGGILLMAAAALALVIANSPLAPAYGELLHFNVAGLSVIDWINDALMAVFFLLVGLEIKRELVAGELSTWPKRALPAIAALGGMAVPAFIYVLVNRGIPGNLAGWAIPAATDIAFALGILSLLGNRVPPSLKIFLAALAILDDLGAVVIIAVFYTQGLNIWALAAAAILATAMVALNYRGVRSLIPYLALGVALWFCVHESGVHSTIAGVILALTIPQNAGGGSPLETLEHTLQKPVAFLIVPVFGFANAGVAFGGAGALAHPVTLGIAAGLFFGKQIGVFGATAVALIFKLGERPDGASFWQLYGVSLICGVGFTMSLFVGLLAFPGEGAMTGAVKLGVLAGSLASAAAGSLVLVAAGKRRDLV
jgi:NhaA family Na+:H+ antiporter